MRTRSLLGCVVASAWVACGGCSGGSGSGSDAVHCLAPASSALTNFSIGTTYNDQVGVQSFATAFPSSLTLTPSGDVLQLSGTVDTFSSFGLSFAACVDASKYSGLAFDLGGSVGPTGMLTFLANTRENSPEPPFSPIGTCAPRDRTNPYSDCRPAYTTLAVSSAAASTMVRFSDFSGGMPAPGADPAEMLSMFFSLPWTSTAQPYAVDLTLGNVTLVQ